MDSGVAVGATVLERGNAADVRAADGRSSVRVPEFFGRAAIVLLYVPQLYRIVAETVRTGRMTALFLLVMTSSVVVLTLVRRSATRVDRTWTARAATMIGTMCPLLFRPADISFVPDVYTAFASLAGFSVTLSGVLALRRSFGLMPAHRGLVTVGPYKVVRHPIYAGYLLVHALFVVAYPTLWNLIVWTTTDTAMLMRIVREERLLGRDLAYARYAEQVRWRVLPGLF